jgi:RNA polymerase sigma-70 factor (ECF subfamily)
MDAAVVRRCLRGDADAIRLVVERFQADVFGLAMRLLAHRHDAEDVTQEVFLRVFRSLRRWDGRRPLRPWITGIAVNRCRTWIARRRRIPRPVACVEDKVYAACDDDGQELLKEIDLALAQLRPEFREAFVLFHERGESYEQIALALARPVGTIKTWLHRSRMQVLSRLRQRGMVPEAAHEMP